ncbi:MAG: T9SS-dependent M36 family metallopeptidase [Bacteroidota bacterium]
MKRTILLIALLCGVSIAHAQSYKELVRNHLSEHSTQYGLSEGDIADWKFTDRYTTKHNSVEHVYIQQTHRGIPVVNAINNFNIWRGQVLNMGNRFIPDLAGKVNATSPSLNPIQAVEAAAAHLELSLGEPLRVQTAESQTQFVIGKSNISLEDIPVKLSYQPGAEGEVRLAWDLSIYVPSGQAWWSLRIDALTGAVLEQINWVSECNFDDADHTGHAHPEITLSEESVARVQQPDDYRVYAMPVESPNHGARTLEVNPATLGASPFGWHDDNGQAGAEYTITRGNNVHAYEDRDDDNQPGYSPDGGNMLIFDFPLNFNQAPSGYQDAAITNLFYWNNVIHDVMYEYGFDEPSGNFQENNYGNGGSGSDYVRAEAQDGGGTNNANFATPPDGSNPRMQMYLWTSGSTSSNFLNVNSPSGIAGPYSATEATFGPGIPTTPITADVVLVEDNTNPDPNDACDPITNAAAINGKIALLNRGNCTFVAKVEAAQTAGAVAVIVINNQPGAPIAMGGASNTITIPSIMISQGDGAAIVGQLNNNQTVNATISNSSGNFDTDGDFDNGVIVHEYGHGITNRLTGGPSQSGCLGNGEQMGEGWSDYFGLIMTIEPGDQGSDIRGIGTFATGQSTTGQGIRNAPYSTSFNINNFTYAATNNTAQVSQPHGVGFVWCTMIWDMTWALINQYGFDPDIYNGTGGNNIALQLVIDGCKLQPCSPGFVDGRDAILQADMINNNGANQCLIWEAFANRGLGFSASQGSANSRTDQTEAFDLPPQCLTPVQAPIGAFASENGSPCGGQVFFTDQSTQVPQNWNWDFGDGGSSTMQNPSHTYTASGTYTVILIVGNTIGNDTVTQLVTVSLPDPPIMVDGGACVNSPVTLSGTVNGSGYLQWQDLNGNPIATGLTYTTPPLAQSTSYQAVNIISFPAQNVGPTNSNFGGGGYHGTTFTGTVNFTANDGLTIISAWVDADGAGNRDLFLWNGDNGTGTVVQQVTVNIPNGISRVQLGFQVPGPGDYSIGGTGVNMFRNNDGASYPYTISSLITLTGSSAGPDFYYYLYDLEVQRDSCVSDPTPVNATVADAAFTYNATLGNVAFTDGSTGATSWSWDFGDGNSSTTQSPTHTYTQNGTYVVTLSINGGTCIVTDTLEVFVVGVEEDLNDPASVTLLPNPTTGLANLLLTQAAKKAIEVQVITLDGRVVRETEIGRGRTQVALDISDLPNAMYFVSLKAGDKSVVKKLVLQQ